MTLNERLYVAGLLDTFDDAARQRDRDRMLAILRRVGLAAPEFTVDAVLAEPGRYGY